MPQNMKKESKGTANRKSTKSKTKKIPENSKAKRTVSKTRQARMREEKLKSTLHFGVKLVIVLAVVIGCAQLFFYGKNLSTANIGKGSSGLTYKEGPGNGPKEGPVQKEAPKQTDSKADSSEAAEQKKDKTEASKNAASEGREDPENAAGEEDGGTGDASGIGAEEPSGQTAETIEAFGPYADGPGSVELAAPPSGTPPAQNPEFSEALFPVAGPVDTSKPMIAFTFDDGPFYQVDQRILDVLKTYGGRATFFIVGSRADNYKDTLKRIHDSGSEIGNHTYNHKNLETAEAEEVLSQVEMTNDAVEAITGFRPKLVRVPYGAFKGQVPGLVAYPMIQWNIDTQDWSSKDKDAVVSAVMSQARDGSIVLMHDLYPSTADAFEVIIPQLAAQGYQFVTVSEMYAAKGIPLEAGRVYFNIHN